MEVEGAHALDELVDGPGDGVGRVLRALCERRLHMPRSQRLRGRHAIAARARDGFVGERELIAGLALERGPVLEALVIALELHGERSLRRPLGTVVKEPLGASLAGHVQAQRLRPDRLHEAQYAEQV